MARGWESKFVEEQQSQAGSGAGARSGRLTPAEADARRRKESLLLARRYTAQQLAAARNPHHRKLLEDALADLDARLGGLD